MRIENNALVYEKIKCDMCDGSGMREYNVLCPNMHKPVKQYASKKCPECNAKNMHSHTTIGTEIKACWSCDNGLEQENCTSYIPRDLLAQLYTLIEFRVYRSDRVQSINESLFGLGCVRSVTDYGRYKTLTDAELIAKVIEDNSRGVQACKLVRDNDNKLPEHIGIFCNAQGYSIRAVHAA